MVLRWCYFFLAIALTWHLGHAATTCEQFCSCVRDFGPGKACTDWLGPNPCERNSDCPHDVGDGRPLNADDFRLADQFERDGKYVIKKPSRAAYYETTSNFFEGDMLDMSSERLNQIIADEKLLLEFAEKELTPDQLSGADPPKVPDEVQYAAQRNAQYKWPGAVVPYTISSYYNSKQRGVIAMAIKAIESETCVRFEPRRNEKHYISIYPAGAGTCAASVGRQFQRGGQQAVMLGSWCLWSKGTAIHELLHAIGFFHEQSRADRDEYVTIYWQNIPRRTHYNFRKYDLSRIQHLGVPYDYKSIMHYSSTAFGKPDSRGHALTTIQPKQRGVKIGQRDGLSHYDAEKINRLYCQGRRPERTTTTTRRTTTRWTTRPWRTTTRRTTTDRYPEITTSDTRYSPFCLFLHRGAPGCGGGNSAESDESTRKEKSGNSDSDSSSSEESRESDLALSKNCRDIYNFCDTDAANYWCNNEIGSYWNEWMRAQCPRTCRVCF